MRGVLPLLLGLLLLVPAAAASHPACVPSTCLPVVPIPDVPYFAGPVDFEAMSVHAEVVDSLATTRLGMTLSNPAATAREATVSIPLPAGASLLAFNLSWSGHHLVGVVKERGQAVQQYEEAQQQGLDAAILEEAGRHLVRLRVNVGPGEERVLNAAYVEPVPLMQGARVYRLPLSQLDPAPAALSVDVSVQSSQGFVGLQAPLLAVALSGGSGSLDLAQPDAGDIEDLVLVWGEEGEQRSFLVAASDPAAGATHYWGALCATGTPIRRDVVFVLDQSGSMAGVKMEEGRQTLAAALESVGPDDRYGIVLFSDGVTPFSSALVPGDSLHVQADRERVLALGTLGGTNIDAALTEAFGLLNEAESSRLPMVVFLTDGLPTVGVTDHRQIIANAKAANHRDAAIHVVPIGLDADYTFLADLALSTGGTYSDLGNPDASTSDHLARLADILSKPVVMSPQLHVDGLAGLQLLPRTLPAIFLDGCLDVRMEGNATGPITLRLDGEDAGGAVHHEATFALSDIPVLPAVKALWGQALVADLLMQERAQPSPALRQGILQAAVGHSQLSPYTAWVLAASAPAPVPAAGGANGGANVGAAPSGAATGTVTSGQGNSPSMPGAGVADQAGDGDGGDIGESDDGGDAEVDMPGFGLLGAGAAVALALLALGRRRRA